MRGTNFVAGVDLRGVLRNMAQGDGTCMYVHTVDNDVHYYIMKRDADGNHRCAGSE